MKIVFSKNEIAEILKREADVMVSNYHVGRSELTIKESTNYIADVTVEVELKEPEVVQMDESDLVDVIDQPEEAEEVNHTHDVDLGIYDPTAGLKEDDSTPGDTFMHEGLK